MINWFNNFWQDLGTLPKWEIGCKYFLPAIAFFFTWGIFGHLYTIQLDTKSLTAHFGRVESITIKFEQGTRRTYKYYPLKISLDNNPEEYRVPDTFTESFAQLENEIKVGDTITIYTRNKLQTFIGLGEQVDIYQIDKNGKILFPLKLMVHYEKEQGLIFGVFAVLLWLLYLAYKKKYIQ